MGISVLGAKAEWSTFRITLRTYLILSSRVDNICILAKEGVDKLQNMVYDVFEKSKNPPLMLQIFYLYHGGLLSSI
jgi:hypothetical protein